MSDLHDLMTRAAHDVSEPTWAAAQVLRATGRRRTRQRRAVAASAVLLTAAAGVALWAAAVPVNRAAPEPVAPTTGCLTLVETPHRAGSPYTVLVGGRQLLRIELAKGQSSAVGPCVLAGTTVRAIPMTGARVVQTTDSKGHDGVTISGPSGETALVEHSDDDNLTMPEAQGRLRYVRILPRNTERLDTYDITGKLVASAKDNRVTWGDMGSTVAGDVMVERCDAKDQSEPLGGLDKPMCWIVVDPTTGARLSNLGHTGSGLGLDATHFAQVLPGGHPTGKEYPVDCVNPCPPVQVTNVVTGTKRNYPGLSSARAFTAATFSPDGKWVALGIADAEDEPGGGSVSVVDLDTGAMQTIPGIHNSADRLSPSVSWTPDSKALVMADTTAHQVRLLVWGVDDHSLRVAATLAGDTAGVTVQAVGPTLSAWQ